MMSPTLAMRLLAVKTGLMSASVTFANEPRFHPGAV
jgi:hypothetical protein